LINSSFDLAGCIPRGLENTLFSCLQSESWCTLTISDLIRHLPPETSINGTLQNPVLLPLTAMISVASLLNPDTPETGNVQLSPGPHPHCPPASSHYDTLSSSRTIFLKQKMSKDDSLTKGRIVGKLNFPPFEDLNEADVRETQIYQVQPLGRIRELPRHIPYNSGKKDFFEKTGRDSFEGVNGYVCTIW